jgi:hypothetical protein
MGDQMKSHIINPEGKDISYAHRLKPGMLLSITNEIRSPILAVTKLDGERLTFICRRPG